MAWSLAKYKSHGVDNVCHKQIGRIINTALKNFQNGFIKFKKLVILDVKVKKKPYFVRKRKLSLNLWEDVDQNSFVTKS